MKHRIKGRKLGRRSEERRSLFANLAKSLITHEQISTTLPKAKELSPYVEKLITLGKKGLLHHKKMAFDLLRDYEIVNKLFNVVAPRYKERSGGYSRIIKNGFRYGDCAPVAIIELVDRDVNAKGLKERELHKKKIEENMSSVG
jgi:large subunit ribosomal protein L17